MSSEVVQSLEDIPLYKSHYTPGGDRDSLDDYAELTEEDVNHE